MLTVGEATPRGVPSAPPAQATGWLARWWPVFALAAIGLFPLTYFEPGLLLTAGEGIKDLDLYDFYRNTDFWAWKNIVYPGAENLWLPHLFPIDAFFYLGRLGIPFRWVLMGWHVALSAGAAVSMYFLVGVLARTEDRRIWGVFAALLYLFNAFSMHRPGDENIRLVHVAMPLFFALFVRGLRGPGWFRPAVLLAMSSLIFATPSVNPPAVSAILVVSLAYLAWDLVTNRGELGRKLAFGGAACVLYVLFNAWWLTLTIPSMLQAARDVAGVMGFSAPTTDLVQVLRLMGSWAFRAGHMGIPYFPYADRYYDFLPVVLATYAVLGIGVSVLLLRERSRIISFFLLLLLLGIYLVKGASPPLGVAYDAFMRYVPGAWIFREPFNKFTPVVLFALSVLFGYACSRLLAARGLPRRLKALGLAGVLCAVVLACHPMFTGEMFRSKDRGVFKSQMIKFPDYWRELGQWLFNADPEAKVFVLPRTWTAVFYQWEHGFACAGPTTLLFFPNPVLTYRDAVTEGEVFVDRIFQYVPMHPEIDMVKLLNRLGTRYILFEQDLDWEASVRSGVTRQMYIDYLNGLDGVEHVRTFGKLDLYRIKADRFRPLIFGLGSPPEGGGEAAAPAGGGGS